MKLFVVKVRRVRVFVKRHVVYCRSKAEARKMEWADDDFVRQVEDDEHEVDPGPMSVLEVEPLTEKNMPPGWDGECYPWSSREYWGDGTIADLQADLLKEATSAPASS